MPPKAKPAASSVYVVVSNSDIDSVHATLDSANERVAEARSAGSSAVKVEVQQLLGGTVQIEEAKKEKAAAKPKAKAKKDEEVPKPKTKPVAEQGAANAAKGTKPTGENVPENVQVLLDNPSTALTGQIVVVTGVPPVCVHAPASMSWTNATSADTRPEDRRKAR